MAFGEDNFLSNFLGYDFGGNTGKDLLWATFIFLGLLGFFNIFTRVVIARLRKISKKTQTDVDDFVISLFKEIKPPFYFFLSLYIALQFLVLNKMIGKVVLGIFVVVVVIQGVLIGQKVIDFVVLDKLSKKEEGSEEDDRDRRAMIKLIGQIVKWILWVIGILLILSNLGINITSLIAGLGIGGIAVALAVQNILGDIFAFFSIFVDKPFQVGDFVVLGPDEMGKVEKIGIKSTRIRTLQGHQLIVPNRKITDANINNYETMQKRRVLFSIGVVYGTSQEKLEKIPNILKEAIEKHPETEFGRVHFKEFGDFSLNFEVVFYVLDSSFEKYLDIRQAINFEILKRFEEEKIEFAFPTQTIFLAKEKSAEN